jgi:hypothetical protein
MFFAGGTWFRSYPDVYAENLKYIETCRPTLSVPEIAVLDETKETKNWKKIYDFETLTCFEKDETWREDDNKQITVENSVKE